MTTEPASGGPQQLLERDRELAEIDGCIAAARAGQGSFLVLEGRPGAGKSALLAEVRRRAAEAGMRACSARASELEGEFSFGVVRQLFEPAVGALSGEERAHVFEGAGALAEPVLGMDGGPAAGGEFAALHGLYWLAANLAAGSPLLLAVDDAHWVDAASLRWLAYLLNRLEGLPLLVVVATRPPRSGRGGGLLGAIVEHPEVRVLAVRPLGEGSVAKLARAALGAEPDPTFTAACLRATAGNPLVLRELLRELRAGEVRPTGAATDQVESAAPDAIGRRVLRELRLLGDEADRLAKALAVIGDGTKLPLIARLAELEVDRAAEAADDLQAADLIGPERPPQFVHPLLRAAIYDRLPVGARQRLHRRAAEILASEGAEPEAIAAHLLRCEPGQSADRIAWLRAAAPAALCRGNPEAAITYLKRAAAESADAATRSAVLAELGRAEQIAGNPAAHGHLQEALSGTTDRCTRGSILCDLGIVIGDESAMGAVLCQALEELRGCDPATAAKLECLVAGLSATDPRSASSTDSRYPRLRELSEGPQPNAELARATLAFLLSLRDGNREDALSCIGSGFEWKALVEGPYVHPFGVLWAMLALLGIDELSRCASLCESVIDYALAQGYALIAVTGMVFKAHVEWGLGLLAEAEADATLAVDMSKEQAPYWTPLARAYLAEILLERGRPQAAFDMIEDVSWDFPGAVREATLREVRGHLRCRRGWRERGLDDLRASGRLCQKLGLRNPIAWSWRPFLATALAQDRPDEARQLAEENLDEARRSGIPRAIGVALRTLAQVDHVDSVDLLRASAAALEGSPGQLDLARALANLGSVLRRQGHRVEARQPLREALEIAARCGAVPLMEWVQEEALASGARPRRPRIRGADALTPSELRVARLAAEGRSNREIAQTLFITSKTVADHLGSSYSKLDITSRGQLTTALGLSTE